ncbi:MAG: hypothetical protein ACI4R8_00725 [Candidatus Caccovivens sp.]
MLSNWKWNGIGPGMYSWFHIIWLVICIALCVLLGIYGKKNKNSSTVDKVILILDIILIISEIIKQLVYHIGYYHYLRIDVLPYSFCSVPMYFALAGSLIKNEKVKGACYKFIAFYGIVGGVGAMLYPISLQTDLVYISLQTMLWHTILTAMSVYLIVVKGYGTSFKKEIMPSFFILVVCSLVAVGLNEVTYHCYLEPKQAVEITVDYDPGAYEYYNFGIYKETDDSLSLISIKDNKLSMTNDYKKASNVVIVYYNDNSDNLALQILDENDNYKYISIDNNKNLVITDDIQTFWEFAYYEDETVFVTKIDYVDYFINSQLQVSSDEQYAEHLNFVSCYVEREGDYANFFFISNHSESNIPILNIVQKVVPYPVFVIIYLAGFFSISSLVFLCVYIIRKIIAKNSSTR